MTALSTYEPAPDDPCPCARTRKRARNCCLIDGQWKPRTARTAPPGPKTGRSHDQCYAASLNDCSTDISLEHCISESVLDLLLGPRFELSGLPGMRAGETTKDATDKALARKVLCTRHNNALSLLDEAGKRFAPLRVNTESFNSASPGASFAVFNGADLERFMLKTLCGLLASKLTGVGGAPFDWHAEPEWNEILWGQKELEQPRGLRFGVQTVVTSLGGVQAYAPLTMTDPTSGLPVVTGLRLDIAGFALILGMVGKVARIDGAPELSEFIYRPRRLIFTNGSVARTIHLYWPTGGGNQDVVCTFTGSPSPE
jgi:hypothetical protein